ncbi:hypothetical protein DSC45_23625 [Streptomyces sp. YIM 130001]|nr:hypothetical protein DSC45_23625 [Streptomyces sp. YIM 130001]
MSQRVGSCRPFERGGGPNFPGVAPALWRFVRRRRTRQCSGLECTPVAPWLAYTGEFDERDGHATLVFAHAPENDHAGEAGTHPAHWFVRNEPIPVVGPSWAFHEELVLAPGADLARR